MNKKKTQFITAMNYQRRKPGHISRNVDKRFDTPVKVDINGSTVEEGSFLKTLGVAFDNEVNFKIHWESVTKSCWNKLFDISHLKSHLDVNMKKHLGQGLILSKIMYCIEATSSCPKNSLSSPSKLLNRTVRTILGEWRWEETRFCYMALNWLNLKETAVLRIYMMARKIIMKKNPIRILSRFAEVNEDGNVKVKENNTRYRTEMGRRMFGARVRRLWSILDDEEKLFDPKNRSQMNLMKDKVRTLDCDWVLWGSKVEESRSRPQEDIPHSNGNDDMNASGNNSAHTTSSAANNGNDDMNASGNNSAHTASSAANTQSHEQNIHQDEDVYDDNAENNPPTTNLANVREDEAYLPVWSAQELLTLMMIEDMEIYSENEENKEHDLKEKGNNATIDEQIYDKEPENDRVALLEEMDNKDIFHKNGGVKPEREDDLPVGNITRQKRDSQLTDSKEVTVEIAAELGKSPSLVSDEAAKEKQAQRYTNIYASQHDNIPIPFSAISDNTLLIKRVLSDFL